MNKHVFYLHNNLPSYITKHNWNVVSSCMFDLFFVSKKILSRFTIKSRHLSEMLSKFINLSTLKSVVCFYNCARHLLAILMILSVNHPSLPSEVCLISKKIFLEFFRKGLRLVIDIATLQLCTKIFVSQPSLSIILILE